MRLVLLGPPGAGKGTLAGQLKERFGLSHISTGDMLREAMASGSDIGAEAKSYVDGGKLVPDQLVIKLIENKLSSGSVNGNGFMLDGFPRTTAQAEELDKILNKINQPVEHTVYLEADLPVILMRLTGRRVCKKCGALFHLKNKPPKQENICDECGGSLYQRPDDNEETIRTRMDVYSKNTSPIIDYYAGKGTLKKVYAGIDADTTLNLLLKSLNEDKGSD